MSRSSDRATRTPVPDAGPREGRLKDSQTRVRTPVPPEGESLHDVRTRAVSMREQGWRWEMQGRAHAYREAAAQVRRWLMKDGTPPDLQRVEFLADLLERSADVYETQD